MFTANAAGAQIGQAVGLLRQVLTPPKSATSAPDQRYPVITPAGSRTAVAVQDQFQPMPPPEGPSPEPAPPRRLLICARPDSHGRRVPADGRVTASLHSVAVVPVPDALPASHWSHPRLKSA